MSPKSIPDRWAKLATLLGIKIPRISKNTHKIPAMKIGIGNPKAQTINNGLSTMRVPITPKIAPDAPKALSYKKTDIRFARMPVTIKIYKNLFPPIIDSNTLPNRAKAKALKNK